MKFALVQVIWADRHLNETVPSRLARTTGLAAGSLALRSRIRAVCPGCGWLWFGAKGRQVRDPRWSGFWL